jgi:PAS domain S-box-containing protein
VTATTSNPNFRSILEASLDAGYQRDIVRGVYNYVSPVIEEVTGYTPEEFSRFTLSDLLARIHPDDVSRVEQAIEDALHRGSRGIARYRFKRKDGEYRWFADYFEVTTGADGHPEYILGGVRDITGFRDAMEELRKSGEKLEAVKGELEERVRDRTLELRKQADLMQDERDLLKTVIESMSDGVWLVDGRGRILLRNAVAKEQAREIGMEVDSLSGPDLLSQVDVSTLDGKPVGMDLLARVLQEKRVPPVEIRLTHKSGGPVFFRRISASRVIDRENHFTGAVVVVHDITALKRAEEERARLEEQLRQAQKMEAVGRLAGGIAHDFNNMLAVVIGNAELALDDVKGATGTEQHLDQIVKASKRARDLVKQILAFSRRTESGKNAVNLAPLVRNMYELLRGTLPATIVMELDIRTDQDAVLADPSQIEQIVMNLATNGAYAMREKGGLLKIGLSLVHVSEKGPKPDPHMAPGVYVKLSVQDTGTGMTEKVRRRVFEPFFTTKEMGVGTGMGLAVAYGIAKSHDGAITFETEVGRGSTFNVFLPHTRARVVHKREDESTMPGGTERILLVDDEPSIVNATSQTLRRLGYRVTSAGSGSEALHIFMEDPRLFDMVITDQTMPDLTGIDLAKRMLERRERLPVILITGYSETVSAEQAKEAGITEFVMKPVVRREIAQAIRRVLDAETRA